MTPFLSWASAHPLMLLGLYMLFSNAVGTLPNPSGQNAFYSWAYAFLHALASNLPHMIPALRLGNPEPQPPNPAK